MNSATWAPEFTLLLVERLDRALIEEAITTLLQKGDPQQWFWRDDEDET
jgi:hypothetical protein